MVEYEPGTAINTHPDVVTGAALACRRAGASEVVIGEGPGHRRDIEYLLSATGLDDQLRARVIGLDPSKIEYLRAASRFLGPIDDARIIHRGESPPRYMARFDVVPALEHLRMRARASV
jgi:hypothetical protein